MMCLVAADYNTKLCSLQFFACSDLWVRLVLNILTFTLGMAASTAMPMQRRANKDLSYLLGISNSMCKTVCQHWLKWGRNGIQHDEPGYLTVIPTCWKCRYWRSSKQSESYRHLICIKSANPATYALGSCWFALKLQIQYSIILESSLVSATQFQFQITIFSSRCKDVPPTPLAILWRTHRPLPRQILVVRCYSYKLQLVYNPWKQAGDSLGPGKQVNLDLDPRVSYYSTCLEPKKCNGFLNSNRENEDWS